VYPLISFCLGASLQLSHAGCLPPLPCLSFSSFWYQLSVHLSQCAHSCSCGLGVTSPLPCHADGGGWQA
jgi:hypothetical protein